MIRSFFARIGQLISSFVQNPIKVFVTCLLFVFLALLIDGSLLRLWRLNRDSKEIARRMDLIALQSKDLDQKILRAHDPAFIELQAREKLDLASEGDLVFVFSDDE